MGWAPPGVGWPASHRPVLHPPSLVSLTHVCRATRPLPLPVDSQGSGVSHLALDTHPRVQPHPGHAVWSAQGLLGFSVSSSRQRASCPGPEPSRRPAGAGQPSPCPRPPTVASLLAPEAVNCVPRPLGGRSGYRASTEQMQGSQRTSPRKMQTSSKPVDRDPRSRTWPAPQIPHSQACLWNVPQHQKPFSLGPSGTFCMHPVNLRSHSSLPLR